MFFSSSWITYCQRYKNNSNVEIINIGPELFYLEHLIISQGLPYAPPAIFTYHYSQYLECMM